MEKMTIWLLTSEYPPIIGGGISTYCVETANMFSERGHTVTIFTQDFSVNSVSETKSGNIRVVRFNPARTYTVTFLGYEANLSFAFAEIVGAYISKEGPPAIIEAQEYMGIAYYLLQFKHLRYPGFETIKILITLHSPSFLYLEYNKVPYHRLPYYWIGEMEKYCIAAADMLISPSKYLELAIRERMDISTDVHHVLNPFKAPVTIPQHTVEQNKVVFLGKLIPQKGCLELLQYFRELWLAGFNWTLHMIGGGNHLYHPEGLDMTDFITRRYKTEIRAGLLKLHGQMKKAEIDRLLQDAQVVVIPSIVDNLPYTVLESMSRGKVVLASSQGGQSEIISHGIDGFLFSHDESGSFQKNLLAITNLPAEDKKTVRESAYRTVSSLFDYERVYQKKIRLLQELATMPCASAFPFTRSEGIKKVPVARKPLLSVIVPFYNMGRYVEECVASVRASHYSPVEIVIVDDGSDAKESIQVLEMMKAKYDVKVIKQPNGGLPAARNFGVKHATGDYIAFLDPDDTVATDYYEKAMRVLEQCHNVSFVGCWAKYFGGAKGYWPAFIPEPPYLLFHNMINSSALVYKKSAFLDSGLNDSRMVFGMEDYDSVIGMIKHGYRGVVLPEALWNYRVRKGSMARSFTIEKQLFLYRLMSQKHADLFARHASELSNLLNANGPGMKFDNPTMIYDLPGSRFLGKKLAQRIVIKIKTNIIWRKVAVVAKKRLAKK